MSTNYRSTQAIPFAQLFDGRLEKYGVYETIQSDSTEQMRCLVGRDGVLEAYREDNGSSSFARPSFTPVPWAVLDALVQEFEVELVCEHDPRYWGFATEKEWHDWQDQLANEADDHLYDELVRYVRNEPNDLRPGTVGMLMAEITTALVASDESLMAPQNRDRLLEAVKASFNRDHTVAITLTKKNLAAVELMAARTNELPQA